VKVLTPQDYTDPSEVADFNRHQLFKITTLPTHPVNIVRRVKRLCIFNRALESFRPQMVIASGARAIWLSALLLPVRKIPWVVIGHGTEFGAQSGLATRITRMASNRACGVIGVSAYTLNLMRKLGVVKPPDFMIHNGADQHAFYPLPDVEVARFRQEASVTGKFVLLTVGNVSERKGQEVVIRALPQVLQSRADVVYWMAGLPQEQTALQKLAAELDVVQAIRFWGRVEIDQLHRLYNACDLFVMTSRQLADGDFEGYGIAVLEAALCGKPALVSDNSGLAEAVQNGITGLIVPQNDPAATAEAILNLAGSPRLLSTLGKHARQNVLNHQTWEQVVARYQVVLEEIYHEYQGDAQ
jgi:phosphatidyl-myo-inositol dimannoside synthase